MFTGIITDIGRVRSIEHVGDGGTRVAFDTAYDTSEIALGASIACAGICLTVVDTGRGWFAVEASNETLARTTMSHWAKGSPINLERALCVGDELGGHIVSGHVDGVATVAAVEPDGDSLRYVFQVDGELARFIAEKGSVTIDGVSLTVNGTSGDRFDVNIIPYTHDNTTFKGLDAGDHANVEIDMLARYVARLQERP
jgi:riboflavin synthase